MQTNTVKNQTHSFSPLKTLVLGLVLALSVVSCSSGGGSTPPVVTSDDASGLFTGTGTVNGTTSLAAVRGFVHSNRFIFFDAAQSVLYDGQISQITGNDLTATMDVYKDGAKVNTSSVSVTGTVISQSSLLLTLSGTGFGAGTLTLTFDLQYNRTATIAKLSTVNPLRWVGDEHTPTTVGSGTMRLHIANDVNNIAFDADLGGASSCIYDGTKSIPNSAVNIYLINTMVVTDTGGLTCDHVGTGFTGFFAVVDGVGMDDVLLFGASNGVNSNFSIMTRQ